MAKVEEGKMKYIYILIEYLCVSKDMDIYIKAWHKRGERYISLVYAEKCLYDYDIWYRFLFRKIWRFFSKEKFTIKTKKFEWDYWEFNLNMSLHRGDKRNWHFGLGKLIKEL